MFIVDIWENGVRLEPKVFTKVLAANAFAAGEAEAGRTATVYKVPVEGDPYAAVAALGMGRAELVSAPQHKAMPGEIAKAEGERAQQIMPLILTLEMLEERHFKS